MHEGPRAAIAIRDLASVLERAGREVERWDLGAWNTDGFPTGEKAGTGLSTVTRRLWIRTKAS